MKAPNRRPWSLDGLHTFAAVARRLSFGGAADGLHLTQAAISRHALGEMPATPATVATCAPQ